MRLIPLLMTLSCLVATQIHAADAALTPDAALQRLTAGNKRFASGKTQCTKNLLSELQQSKDKQKPYAAILCCSDSRVPAELIFDESLGKLFIIRVAGNVATEVTIGSIEYAVAQLQVPLIVVLGHEACGVLVAALKGEDGLPPFVRDLVKEVSQSVFSAEKDSKNFSEEVHIAVNKNVDYQIEEIMEKSEVIRKAVESKATAIKGAIFHFKDGSVEWCPCKK